MADTDTAIKLTPKQEKFCELYATDREFFGNGTLAYAEAYGINLNVRGTYKTAQANASRLLSNAKILEKINSIMELRGLNDTFVDKQLEMLITQNADYRAKVQAIKEYNALKSRITARIDHTTKGDKLPSPQVYLPTDLPENAVASPDAS